MRRITSLFMIAALLSVTSLPLLPQAAEGRGYCTSCHSDPSPGLTPMHQEHAHMMQGSGMEMQHSMEHNNHDDHGSMMHHDAPEHGDHDMKQHDHQKFHKQKRALTAAEKECRIECACGCNRSVDGFPQVLSPHITPSIEFNSGEQTVRTEPEIFPALQSIERTTPLPPPKRS